MATATKTAPTPATLPAMQAGGKVIPIVPQNFQEAAQFASAVVRAGMNPKSLDTTDKVVVAILHGLEVGFTPMAALQSIAVINGMPSVYGDGLVALVRASGLLEDMVEEITVDEKGIPEVARCRVKRKGEATWGEQMVTRIQCQKAGWWSKAGPWSLTPGRMMSIRARGWALRDKFADVLRGLHSAEEVQDMIDITPAPPEPQRKDYEESAAVSPADAGQAVTSPPTAGGSDRKAGMPPAEPEAAAPPTQEIVDKSQLTDVEDLNDEPEPLSFETYTRVGDFFAFADTWLEDDVRTEAELVAFGSFYHDYMLKMAEHKNPAIRSAVEDTKKIYGDALKRATKR